MRKAIFGVCCRGLIPAILVGLAAIAQAQVLEECGVLENAYGPFDYRTAERDVKVLVEERHFPAVVETLSAGSTGSLAADIDYTLRVFPNHPRALMAMTRLAEREKRPKARGAGFSVACYFDRAIRFQPNDREVRSVYGYYLLRAGDKRGAIRELERASEGDGAGSANVHYNLGLAYFDLGEFEKSLAEAHAAYRLGFPLPGLREKLKRAHKWRDA